MTTPDQNEGKALARTALYECHRRHGAKFVAFAGYEMPINYAPGVLREHLHTRASVGVFDVSHMGQILLRHNSGNVALAARELEGLVPADIVDLGAGRQRYTLLLNKSAGIEDDLMVANLGTHLAIVVNAATKGRDEEILRAHLGRSCSIEVLEDHALVAVQGPLSESVLLPYMPELAGMKFMDVRTIVYSGTRCVVARSGYTGEDGFEISLPSSIAEPFVERVLLDKRAALIGLGARDSLRLEAGLSLYGSDLDPSTTPVAAALEWSIQKVRKKGGTRSGGFLGAERVLDELENGPPTKRVGLLAKGKAPVRAGALLFDAEDGSRPIGTVTSGGFGPTAGRPIAMGYVEPRLSDPGTVLFAEVRGSRLPVEVSRMPFVPHGYKR